MTIAVYAASSTKVKQEYIDSSYLLGKMIAEHNHTLIYGAGAVGLMGAVASGVLDNKGQVIGVIPQFMVDQGWQNDRCTELIVTRDMHERKAYIAEHADAMIALPGGIGTLEELTEILTWKQLGLHTKPIVIFNIQGYYDTLLTFFRQMIDENMIRDIHLNMFRVAHRAEEVLTAINECPKWDSSIRKIAQI